MIRLTRQTLSYSKPADLVRLARFLRLQIDTVENETNETNGARCLCNDCHHYLAEQVVRYLDGLDNSRANSYEPVWPPSTMDVVNKKLRLEFDEETDPEDRSRTED